MFVYRLSYYKNYDSGAIPLKEMSLVILTTYFSIDSRCGLCHDKIEVVRVNKYCTSYYVKYKNSSYATVFRLPICRVNHQNNFLDPYSGTHTQNVETMWRCIEMGQQKTSRYSLKFPGVLRGIIHVLVRRTNLLPNGKDPFDQILSDIIINNYF